jgi:SSS family solute:Na+ symporter
MMIIISLIENARGVKTKGLEIDSSMFKPQPSFVIGTAAILVILTTLYTIYW